jgi:hypothetical protein
MFGAGNKGLNHTAAMVDPTYNAIFQLKYAGLVDTHTLSKTYGSFDLGKGTMKRMRIHTGLVGSAARRPDIVRQEFPMATYYEDEVQIEGTIKLGVGFQYFPAELEGKDAVGFDGAIVVMSKVDDLPRLLQDAEESERARMFVNGETFLGGIFGTPLFCDGTVNKLKLVGREDYFGTGALSGNIIYNSGGIGYSFINQLINIASNFVDEEGMRHRLKVDMIVCNEQDAKQFMMYIDADTNIEQMNPRIKNPAKEAGFNPEIVVTDRFVNGDMVVFLEGWEDHILEFSRYLGDIETGEEGTLTHRKIITLATTAFGHSFISNRLVILVKGV